MVVKLCESVLSLFGRALRLGARPVAEPPAAVPTGLLGRDWSAWRHTALRKLSDAAAEPASYAFVAGYSAAYARLLRATVDRAPIDVATWAKIGRDLDRYAAPPRPGDRRRPSAGDLGRRPTTPLPGGMLDYGAPFLAPERGLS